MKIGVIGDIHSNVSAFRAVLDYMKRERCDEFILLGDFVSDLTYTRETMDEVYKLIGEYPCTVLRGNREEYMLAEWNYVKKHGRNYWVANSCSGSLLYTYKQLNDEDMSFFDKLPISAVWKKDGYPQIACYHGAYDSTRHKLKCDDPKLSEVLADVEQDYIIAGHTHVQGMCTLPNGKVYVNSGSCGVPLGPVGKAHCVIMESYDENGETKWRPELLAIPYDIRSTLMDVFDRDLFDYGRWFTSSNIHTLLEGKEGSMEMVIAAAELADKFGTEPWPHIPEAIYEDAAAITGVPYYDKETVICKLDELGL